MMLTYKDFKGIIPHSRYSAYMVFLRERLLVKMVVKPLKGSKDFTPLCHFNAYEALEAMSKGAVDERRRTVDAHNHRLKALKEVIKRREQCELLP